MVLNDEQNDIFFDTMDALLYYVNDRFACVTWKGVVGYILVDNLGW